MITEYKRRFAMKEVLFLVYNNNYKELQNGKD